MKVFFFGILLWFAPCVIQAQDVIEDTEQLPTRQEYYQIFLEEPAQKVNKVEYSDDTGPVEFKLAPDGKSIHLLNYKGGSGIRAEFIDANGQVQEVVKSKCHIHSLQEL